MLPVRRVVHNFAVREVIVIVVSGISWTSTGLYSRNWRHGELHDSGIVRIILRSRGTQVDHPHDSLVDLVPLSSQGSFEQTACDFRGAVVSVWRRSSFAVLAVSEVRYVLRVDLTVGTDIMNCSGRAKEK